MGHKSAAERILVTSVRKKGNAPADRDNWAKLSVNGACTLIGASKGLQGIWQRVTKG